MSFMLPILSLKSSLFWRGEFGMEEFRAWKIKSFKKRLFPSKKVKIHNHAAYVAQKDPDCIYIGYVGGLGWAQGMETVIEAAYLIKRHGLGKQYRFLILGQGDQETRLKRLAKKRKIDSVTFIPFTAGDEDLYWSMFDIFLIHYKNLAVFEETVSEKVLYCLARGTPILLGMKGVSARIVQEKNFGIQFEPENSEDLVSKLLNLRKEDKKLLVELKKCCNKSQ